jgi:hypothetical protein
MRSGGRFEYNTPSNIVTANTVNSVSNQVTDQSLSISTEWNAILAVD